MSRRKPVGTRSPLSIATSAEGSSDGEELDPETESILKEVTKGLIWDYTRDVMASIDGRYTEEDIVQDNTDDMTEETANDSTSSEADSETTLVDSLPSITSYPSLGYRSSPSEPPTPIPGTLTLTIGAPPTQQSYSLPKALVSDQSTYFATLVSISPNTHEIALPQFTPRNFSNYMHYIQSNIYSPATHIPGYRALGTHVEACLLGAHLGAPAYCDAAIRALHAPLALSVRRGAGANARGSRITPQDVEFVCDQADLGCLPDSVRNTDEYVLGLRRLMFDAVAAQCSQSMVWKLESGLEGEEEEEEEEEKGVWEGDEGGVVVEEEGEEDRGEATDWMDLYCTVPDFRVRLRHTAVIADVMRWWILKDVDYYLEGGGEKESVCGSGNGLASENRYGHYGVRDGGEVEEVEGDEEELMSEQAEIRTAIRAPIISIEPGAWLGSGKWRQSMASPVVSPADETDVKDAIIIAEDDEIEYPEQGIQSSEMEISTANRSA